MPTNKKPRKKYKPREKILDTVTWVLHGAQPLTQQPEYLRNLMLVNHGAMRQLILGKATADDFNALLAMSNASMALLHLGFGGEYESVAAAGFAALKSIGERAEGKDRFVLYAAEITALNEYMELHDAQIEAITVADMERAIKVANQRRLPRLFLKTFKWKNL